MSVAAFGGDGVGVEDSDLVAVQAKQAAVGVFVEAEAPLAAPPAAPACGFLASLAGESGP